MREREIYSNVREVDLGGGGLFNKVLSQMSPGSSREVTEALVVEELGRLIEGDLLGERVNLR